MNRTHRIDALPVANFELQHYILLSLHAISESNFLSDSAA